MRSSVGLMLDLAVVAIAGAMVVTYVVLGPTLRQDGTGVLSNIVSVAYPTSAHSRANTDRILGWLPWELLCSRISLGDMPTTTGRA
jgi:hypothetical protein